ncbi:MAG: trypsin-like serine protease [Myxococcota bacterium]|nr:trypsin-like serine protease [Myxococcota bacterium]
MLSLLSSLTIAQVPPPIVNGEATTEHPQVGVLYLDQPGSDWGFCSASLIAPQWILTAAHCIEAAASFDQEDLGFALTSDLRWDEAPLARVQIESWQTHPDWDGTWDEGGDLGVMKLAEPITDVEPLALNTLPMEGWEGTELVHVGFGVTSDGGKDSGTKRMATLPVQYVLDAAFISYKEGQNVCNGDSGGPSLLQDPQTGDWSIVGVAVAATAYSGPDPCADGQAGSTRVDLTGDWIAEATYEPEPQDTGSVDTGDPTPPTEESSRLSCAQVPAQGVAWLGLLAGLGLLFRRRDP